MRSQMAPFTVILAAVLGLSPAVVAQTAPPAPLRLAALAQDRAGLAVADVRQMVADARKEIETYKTGGGAAGAADHPARKWSAALWQARDRAPQSEAAALAAVEAIRLLVPAELWD